MRVEKITDSVVAAAKKLCL